MRPDVLEPTDTRPRAQEEPRSFDFVGFQYGCTINQFMDDIRSKVLPIIRETRALLMPGWGNPGQTRNKSGGAWDVVTTYDVAVENFLQDKLTKAVPGTAFFAEENGGTKGDLYWLCDPIDGTAHFVRGTVFCTTMVALVKDGKVIFSAIYDFLNDHMYHAELGKGTFRESEPLKVSERAMADAYVGWESHIEKPENLELFLRLRKQAGLFKGMVSGYEFMLVASGKIEGRICFDGYGYIWDYTPGSLLVSEAGGIVTNIGKTTYDPENLNIIMANKPVYEALTSGPNALFPIEK